jgi:shikimate dehydrogenase
VSLDRYAVMGNPIAHSKSPLIHSLFAEQTGEHLTYQAILVPAAGLATALDVFQADGGKGVNVTVPFKEQAWRLVSMRTARCQVARAVNTISFREDAARVGDNTDGAGLVRDLARNHSIDLHDRRILLMGAGGAVRGVLEPLLEQRPQRLVVVNRTVHRAVALAQDFRNLGLIEACGYPQLTGEHFDLVINGTSASLSGALPPLSENLLAPGAVCYDMMYAREPTVFVRWGQAHGAAKSLDGLGMLVEQAAEAFLLWRGVRPETAPVIQTLRTAQ